MRKLLLSFLVIGATVFTSCDKGDDAMTPAQVAADVKVLSIDNPSDFDVFDLDGDNSASGKSSGWSQYKQLVAPNGNKLVYYGSSTTFASENGNKTRKQTVMVMSIADGVLSHYSIRHNDVKLKKQRVTNNRTSYKNGAYEGATIRELIGSHVYGVAGISTKRSASARTGTTTQTAPAWLEDLVDTNNNRWDDLDESVLHLAGFGWEGGTFRSPNGKSDIGYEPGESAFFPYYVDGFNRFAADGVHGQYEFHTIRLAVVATGYEYIGATHFTGPEINDLDDAGFTFVSPGSTSFHAPIAEGTDADGDDIINDYVIIDAWIPKSSGDISPPRQYSVYEEHGTVSGEFETFAEAVAFAVSLTATTPSTPSTPDYIEDTFDRLSGTPVAWSIAEGEALMAAGFVFDDVVGIAANSDVVVQHKNGGWTVGTPTIFNSSARLYTDFSLALAYAISLTSD